MSRFLLLCAGILLSGLTYAQSESLYSLTVSEHSTGVIEGQTTYRAYVDMINTGDFLSSVYGNEMEHLSFSTELGFYNDAAATGATAAGINPFFVTFFPSLAADSWLTIGIEAQPTGEEVTISTVEDTEQPYLGCFSATSALSGQDVEINTQTGGAWYVLNGTPNGLGDDNGQVLVLQFTTGGSFSGLLNVQIFENGDGQSDIRKAFAFDGTGTFYAEGDDTGGPDIVQGCMDAEACNYDSTATEDDGSCQYIDACGVCGGDGFAEGACDCDGNTLDALGVCGGTCTADANENGVCDDAEVLGCMDATACNYDDSATSDDGSCAVEDECGVCGGDGIADGACDCEGNVLDECGVCGGDGIAEGDCDCEGNELDALGVCGGSCTSDANENGICDDLELAGCTDSAACNYNGDATEDDGSCDFCSCGEVSGLPTGYTMTIVEHATGIIEGQTTYRAYLDLLNSDDFVSSIYGNNLEPLSFGTELGFYNDAAATGATAAGINPFFVTFFPSLAADSWLTIGIEAQPTGDEVTISTVEDTEQPYLGCFSATSALSGQDVEINTQTGGAWYVLNGTPNGLGDDNGQVLILQFTTGGSFSGLLNVQIFENGIGDNDIRKAFAFDGVGTFAAEGEGGGGTGGNACGCTDETASNYDSSAEYDDGSCTYDVPGCTDETACNYEATATTDDGSCLEIDECGVCGGNGIPEGACDCDGNVLDECGVCGGNGIPEGACDCDGNVLDECGVCGGDGIADGACDCDGTLPASGYDCEGACLNDADGDDVCDEFEIAGCTDADAPNFNPEATDDDGSCASLTYALALQGIIDFTVPSGGSNGKAIHVVASADIADLSSFGIGVANNGGGTDGEEYSFPAASVSAGDDILVVRSEEAMAAYFADCYSEFEHVFMGNTGISQNGDDAIELFELETVIETFGDINVDGTGQEWEYLDSWAYKVDGIWTYGEVNCTDNTETTYDSDCPYPLCPSLPEGCTDETACNYDSEAILDDGSCLQEDICGVCGGDGIAEGACDCDGNGPEDGYDCDGVCLNDVDGDGTCDEFEQGGCTDPEACNYDAEASEENGTCQYTDECGVCGGDGIAEGACDCDGTLPADGYDCAGACLNDADGDDICDEFEIAGCTDTEAPNFNPEATDDDGSCATLTYALALQGIIDFTVPSGGSNGKAIHVVASVDIADLSSFGIGVANNGGGTDGEEYSFPAASVSAGDDILVVRSEEAMAAYFADCYSEFEHVFMGNSGISQNGDDAIELFEYTVVIETFGDINVDGSGEEWEYLDSWAYKVDGIWTYGEVNCTDNTETTYDSDCPYPLCPLTILGCMDAEACNYNMDATEDDGSCAELDECGICGGEGIAEGACDCEGNVLDECGVCGGEGIPEGDCDCDGNVVDECGVCGGEGIPEGDCDCDGNVADECGVCGGDGIAEGTCDCDGTLPADGYDCDGVCLNDADGDGTCDEFEVAGCTDEAACNYDAAATDEDGSCAVLDSCGVCGGDGIAEGTCDCDGTLPADGYDCDGVCLNDADGDGTCDEFEIAGCTDEAACNYNNQATEEDGSCATNDECGVCGGSGILEGACDCDGNFPEFAYDCDGNCLSDADGDGICDEFEFPGCTDEGASNYEEAATFDDGSCEYAGCTISSACNYDPSWDVLDADACDFDSCVGCTNPAACNYEEGNTTEDGTCEFADADYDCSGACLNDADGDGICDEQEIAGCDESTACNYDEDATENDGSCEYADAGYDCNGACLNDADSDGTCDEFEIAGCTDEAACNYNGLATDDNGSCTFAAAGYDCDGNCLVDSDGDGTCDQFEVFGCTDPAAPNYDAGNTEEDGTCQYLGCTLGNACNYDNSATANDGSCEFTSCLGCNDEAACNFDSTVNPLPNFNDGSCTYADDGYDCAGVCLNDADGDGTCDEFEVAGCQDADACNYNEEATESDQSACDFGCYGCMASNACNFDPTATLEPADACEYESCVGCMNEGACNYDASASVNSGCLFPTNPFVDCDGICLTDTDGDGTCDDLEIFGCSDENAVNYNPNVTEDNGSCVITPPDVPGCIIPSACNFDPAANVYDFSCVWGNCSDGSGTPLPLDMQVPGCTDLFACNYDAGANEDDGSCEYVSCLGCPIEAACNYDPAAIYNDGSCEYVSCLGCTVEVACNYDSEAIYNDGSCDYTSCVGCTDEAADNYDESATSDNGSCLFSGCTFPNACNYDASANSFDGSCEYTSCAGCMDETACTYDPTATISNASQCDYAEEFYGCDGECLSDSDGDGTCDELEIAGCTDSEASNYDGSATDEDGSCTYPVPGCTLQSACNYNPAATTNDGTCEFTSCVGCLDGAACNFDGDALYNDQSECEFPPFYYGCDGNCLSDVDGDGICDETDNCSDASACNYDDAFNLPCAEVDACGVCGGNGVDTDGDGVCDSEEIFGCDITDACNYDSAVTENDGSCSYCGCPATEANFDGYEVIVEPVMLHTSGELAGLTTYRLYLETDHPDDMVTSFTGNGEWGLEINTTSSFYQHFAGGWSALGQNPALMEQFPDLAYDSYVTVQLDGPADMSAMEINPIALPGAWVNEFESGQNITINDFIGSGWYVTPDGVNINVDENNRMLFAQLTTDGIISGQFRTQVFPMGDNFNDERVDLSFTQPLCGCTDESACNFTVGAVEDDGSCVFDTGITDCAGECYNDIDGDGVCDENEVAGCTDDAAANYDGSATDEDGSCEYPNFGCTDQFACNYDEEATEDDGNCEYPASFAVDCDGNCLIDSDGDGICNQDEILGCTFANACNYEQDATEENGSCIFADEGYDCDGNCLEDDDQDGVCNQFEVLGCTDESACNYDMGNTEEDGSCDYCSCGDPVSNYSMTVEEYAVDGIAGMTTYRFYVDMENPTDFLSAMFGTAANPLSVMTSSGFHNDDFASGSTADGINSAFFTIFPSLEYDSWVTIGIDNAPQGSEVAIGTVESEGQPWIGAFNSTSDISGQDILIDHLSVFGGAWYVTNGSANGLPDEDNQRVLFMQLTTSGSISGTVNAQIFPDGNGDNELFKTFTFDGVGTFAASNESENGLGNSCGCTDPEADNFDFEATFDDGNCLYYGCMDATACNYDADANTDDGSCYQAIEGYDCDGVCLNDDDGDGVCNEFEIAGCQDATACNFNDASTEATDCIYADGVCESCSGETDGTGTIVDNDADNDGVCDADEISGCQDDTACNFLPTATDDDASCEYCSCQGNTSSEEGYGVIIDPIAVHTEGELAGMTTYQVFLTTPNAEDVVTALIGDNNFSLNLSSSTSFYQHAAGGVTPELLSEMMVDMMPNLAYDSYVTVGLDGPAMEAGEANAGVIPGPWSSEFEAGGPVIVEEELGGGWYVVPSASNAVVGADLRILVAQLTTDGQITGSFRAQVFPNGDNEDDDRVDLTFMDAICGCNDPIALNYDPMANFLVEGSCDFPVYGCVDELACNFDAESTTDDGSCIYSDGITDCDGNCINDADGDYVCDENEIEGCLNPSACNYVDPSLVTELVPCVFADSGYDCDGNCIVDTDGDGICDEFEVPGCLDEAACNYEPATTDEVECIYEEDGYDCDGNCLADADGDGVCDEFEVVGCTDAAACNYDEGNTDEDGSCDYCSCGESLSGYTLQIEEHAVNGIPGMTTYRFYIGMESSADFLSAMYGSLQNPLSLNTSDGFYNDAFASGGTADGLNAALFGFFPTLAFDSWVTIGVESAAVAPEVTTSTVESSFQPWVGAFVANSDMDGDNIVIDDWTGGAWFLTNGAPNGLPDAENQRVLIMQLTTAGSFDGTLNAQIFSEGDGSNDIFKSFSFDGVGTFNANGESASGAGNACGCTDPEASNYDEDAAYENDTCLYPGCTDADACNYDADANTDDNSCSYAAAGYDCDGNCLNDADGDGVCDEFEVAGCQDEIACNYDADATDSDGSCTYADAGYDCDGNCLNDEDGDGVCDEFEVAGCQDEIACNYDADATDEDGSCTYADEGYDCDGNCLADADGDGVCDPFEIAGCQDDTACNYDADATDEDGSCTYADAGYDCDGVCLNDADGDGVCDEFEVAGCQDEIACNYDADATDSDGSCTYADAGYDCDGNCLNDEDGDGVCDEFEVAGCQDEIACNYDADATDEDGSCTYADEGYDCDGNCLADADGDGVCDPFEIAGCQDDTACNYDADATDEDGFMHVCGRRLRL